MSYTDAEIEGHIPILDGFMRQFPDSPLPGISAAIIRQLLAQRDEAREWGDKHHARNIEAEKERDDATSALTAAKTRISELEEALKPFAELHVGRFMTNGLKYDYRIGVAHIRHARSTLSPQKESRKP